MYLVSDQLLTLEKLKQSENVVRNSSLGVRRTPCIKIRDNTNRDHQTCCLFSDVDSFNDQAGET